MDLDGKTGYELFEELLDVNLSFDEDCLHLAVSTPRLLNEVIKKMTYTIYKIVYDYGIKVLSVL